MSTSVISGVGVGVDVHDETMMVNSNQKRDIRFIRLFLFDSFTAETQSTRRT
jgi:hypothetical protein